MKLVATMLLASALAGSSASSETLLRDDFDAAALDTAKWLQTEGCGTYYGRTQVRPASIPLAVRDGALVLAVDRFNPAGRSFLGSEIGGNGELTITGAGTSWNAGHDIQVGVLGYGQVTVTQGAVVTSSASVAYQIGSKWHRLSGRHFR